ncbi:MAG: HNH endonuclease [Planctomycetes bacterium]|nr:HNH endonuclease [Planctomycetota bacterium]
MADLFTPNQTLLDKYREDYSRAMLAVDRDVAELIQQGKEMRSLIVLGENISAILKIHDALQSCYNIIVNNVATLTRFGSERLRQLGHEPIPLRETIKDIGWDEEEIEKYVNDKLLNAGYTRDHWLIKNILLREVDYMLDALQILVEPEFVPLETRTIATEDAPDRYIPPVVKIAVWRRDEGRCTLCKSREKLEYDHIIPIAKGGSNTERNVQLLCEPCNRAKSAHIQ